MSRDRGQAAVETALALPVVTLLVLGILQVVVIAGDQVAVELAAREAARAAAASGSPATAAEQAALEATKLRPLGVATRVTPGRVAVTVSCSCATDVALIGPAIGDLTLTATVTMAREPP